MLKRCNDITQTKFERNQQILTKETTSCSFSHNIGR